MWTVGAALPAQKTAWRIPLQGAVEYSRDCSGRASDVLPTRGRAKDATCDDPLPARYGARLPPAPWLCQGELRGDQRAVVGQVGDVRDVVRDVAFDLAQFRSVQWKAARLLPFGDVTVRGAWSAMDDAGKQTLTAKFVARPPIRRGQEPRERTARLGALCVEAANGTIEIARVVDVDRGVVTSFEARIDCVVHEAARQFRRLVVEDQWRLVAIRECRDFDFRKRVAAAIRDGATWVRQQVQKDATFLRDQRGERNYGSGRLALALMAMLHGHVAADDPVVARGFAALRRRRLDDAYSLAAALMAFEAWHRRAPLSDRDRKLADKWLRRLLKCIDPRTKPSELLRFNYEAGPRYDTSLQQYGLLGMRAAQRLGLPLPEHAFAAAARHLLRVQAKAEGSLTLALTDHGQLQSSVGTGEMPDAHRRRARVRGFAYQDADEPPFGSMTSAGVSGLLLARAGLVAQRSRDRALRKRIDAAIDAGFAWLAANFSVRVNPGFAERADNHWSYWLYCLERCCELNDVAHLQGRDWYYEGGVQLLASQNPNGSFRASHASTKLVDSTCFAVLFLAKASASGPITGGGEEAGGAHR